MSKQISKKPNRGIWADLEEGEVYCPICAMVLQPINFYEVEHGIHLGYIHRHLNVEHFEEDIVALQVGIQ